jgi:hypothetical protein
VAADYLCLNIYRIIEKSLAQGYDNAKIMIDPKEHRQLMKDKPYGRSSDFEELFRNPR